MNAKLFAMLLLVATTGTAKLDEAEGTSAPKAQPPAELLAKSEELKFGETIVARFHVGSVGTMPVTGPKDEKYTVTQMHPLSDFDFASRNSFHVEVGPDAAAALKRIGITDLQGHFVGKTVTVRGTWQVTFLNLIGSETKRFYHVRVDDLDQFLSVDGAETRFDE